MRDAAGAGAREAAARVFSVTVFPLVMAGSVAVAVALMGRGVEPFLAFGVATLPAYLIVIAGERLFPHEPEWLRARGDVRVDAAFAFTDYLVLEGVRPLLYASALAVGVPGVVGLGLWPQHWPVVIQLVVALVVAELPKYWFHRLEHERDALWRLHAAHHSVPRLYWLNASRFHPVDIAVDTGLGLGTLWLLGCGDQVVALFLLVSAVHGIFQHANLRLRLGPLNWFFSMAELHRWHHSRTVVEANHNYGQNLIVWDVVFGTRFLPPDRVPPPDVGLADMPGFPTTFLGLLASPFRWRTLRGEAPVVRPGVAG
jgi:sterol desaturase/sphingolipid hydroxylase (fatty acid hydroxylase superfamily)